MKALRAEVHVTNQRVGDVWSRASDLFGGVARRFSMYEEILNLTRYVAVDSKLDTLSNTVVDLKDGVRMSVRAESLEKHVAQIEQRLTNLSPLRSRSKTS